MSNACTTCAVLAPTLPLSTLQRRRIAARVNVGPEVAAVLALHAYGQPRDAFVVVAVADARTLAGEVRR